MADAVDVAHNGAPVHVDDHHRHPDNGRDGADYTRASSVDEQANGASGSKDELPVKLKVLRSLLCLRYSSASQRQYVAYLHPQSELSTARSTFCVASRSTVFLTRMASLLCL
jgi:hypothetical protein